MFPWNCIERELTFLGTVSRDQPVYCSHRLKALDREGLSQEE